jgi:penicillin-binding protein 2
MARYLDLSSRSADRFDPFHPTSRRRRSIFALVAVVLALAFLGSAFFRAQILRSHDFLLRADDNRFDVVPIPAPRGAILDRHGELIAETVTGYRLMVEAGPPDSVRTWLRAAASSAGLDSAAIEDAVRRSLTARGNAVAVGPMLSFEQVSALEERRNRFRGITLEATPVRRYPGGPAVAHLVGYVLEIDDRELQQPEWKGYRSGQQIGKSGVERAYEREIGGRAGAQYVERDARGRLVGRFAPRIRDPARGGDHVRLTLDLALQRHVHEIWPAGMRGAVVAMEPSSGAILALYSAPTYDPNLFVGGISGPDWARLNSDPARPLLNRAIAGIYPPGSTWKLATAMVGLERRAITPEARMPIACSGGMAYAGRYSRCWKRDGHGGQNLTQAIANSCNVYFYQLGIRLGLEVLSAEGTRLGFGRRTGVDLPGERPGTFPAGRQWYVDRFGWRPPPSEVMNISIGQGPNSQTPLRMAQFFSALAGDGTARTPHLRARRDLPVETDLRVSGATLQAARDGMAAVLEGGTASRSRLARWRLYGKTGTSQNTGDPARPHAWFTGFAGPRGGAPEVVVAVIVEFGESGSRTAAPLAASVAEFYLERDRARRAAGSAPPATDPIGSPPL